MPIPTSTRRLPVERFELIDAEPGLAPTDLGTRSADWIPARVPGGVHESLLDAGRIEHPYLDQHEESVRWIEDRDWWYRAEIEAPSDLAPGDEVTLVLHGLDTVVDLWWNGEFLGHHENMFRPAELAVGGRLRPLNDLLLRFSPPLAGLVPSEVSVEQLRRAASALMPDLPPDADVSGFGPSPELTVASQRRKAMFSWGWDFGPRVPSIGVWRPVELVVVPRARLTGHHIRTDAVDGERRTAEVTVSVEAQATPGSGPLSADVRLVGPSGRVHEVHLRLRGGEGSARISVEDAELWWTHDLGRPDLYDVTVTLREGDEVLDETVDRVGLRTITVDRSPDAEGGRHFRFVLNGVPVFARGANWLPASAMVGSVPAGRVRELVELARDGGMTMLRVWGGGIYEQDAFYAAADANGVLIWQDFMFACADYPSEDPGLQRETLLEAEHQVRRLRNRACIALWAGNNEVQLLHGIAYQDYEPGNWGWDLFHRILPEVVARLDPTATFWPGSPWGEDGREGALAANGVLDGDRHAWEVWHGFDAGAGTHEEYATVGESRLYRRYAHDRGRFISEFGIHSAPVRSTLERWLPADELDVHSPGVDAHNKDHPKDKHDAVLEIVTGLPRSIDEYVDHTMVSQAEGLKFGIEHYRRREPLCGGALIWQFNDVWPGITWSLVDHDTVPKAAFYAAARAFAPLMASFVQEDGVLSLWISNSGAERASGPAVIALRRFDGEVLREEQIEFSVEAARSAQVWETPWEGTPDTYAVVRSPEGRFPENRLFSGEIRDLPLPPLELRSAVRTTGPTSAEVEVTTDAFAYLVRVTAPHPSARFSDNYIDLEAGSARTIRVTGLPVGFDPADLEVDGYIGARR